MINELSDGEVAEGIYTLSQAIRLCLAGEHNCVQRSQLDPVRAFGAISVKRVIKLI